MQSEMGLGPIWQISVSMPPASKAFAILVKAALVVPFLCILPFNNNTFIFISLHTVFGGAGVLFSVQST
jgi:glycopeptide antibiotics resistance protein